MSKEKKDKSIIIRVLELAKPFKVNFAIATVLALSLAVLGPIRPKLIQLAVDDHILKFDGAGLQRICLIIFGVLVVESIFRYNFIYLTKWLGQSVIKNLRTKVFAHSLNFRLTHFDNTPIGTSVTRTISDVETVNDIFSQGIITIIADILTLLVVLGFMFYMSWQLTLVCLITLPIMIFATYFFKERIKAGYEVVRNKVSQLNAFLQEHISGMSVVQIFNAEKREYEKFRKINEDQKKAYVKMVWHFSIFFPIIEIISAVALGLMIWFGARLVIQEVTQLGVLISFILYLNMLFRPMRMLADKFNTLQHGMVAAERVFKVLDRDYKIKDEGQLSLDKLKGAIEFKNINFEYVKGQPVLNDISFKVNAGETLAIVGSTGSGKTSLINILNRFYPVQSGQILIDGKDIESYKLDDLRSNIGMVLQDVFLFSGSILENITLRNPEIDSQKAIDAAKIIEAHEFIMRLPGQYDYDVMERGATLSMGQRQLISFIRAMVYDPQVLILDEATSSIDTESEMLIQKAIEKLIKGRTSIVIAHRLSTIQNADKIIVLDQGKIVEQGTHKELLMLNGIYRQLHDMQFSKEVA